MQPSSFANIKDLEFVITLSNPNNSFADDGNKYNTITLSGLRAAVSIDNAGGAYLGTLKAQIFGVSESHMNTLTSLQWDNLLVGSNSTSLAFNTIQVYAVDGTQKTLIYNGIILNCWGDYSAMPAVCIAIDAQIGYQQQVQSATPTSIASDTTVDTVMSQIAAVMGFSFVNDGVRITVPAGTYLGNTAMEQARTLAQMYRFWMYMDGSTNPNTLVITPYGSPRSVISPVISAQTGMIGYPAFNSSGIIVETLFNPSIVFGGSVKVQSLIPKANGDWIVTSMSHSLTSQMPSGPWKSTINCVPYNIGSSVGVS